jgi:hypothetical protein
MYARSARGASTATHGVGLRRSLEVVGALLATLLIFSASANAFSQRGHVPVAGPSGSFDEGGNGGTGEAPPSRPSAIAVNEATTGEGAGDVYALESANNRVMRYGPAPEHKFIEAWGFGVNAGGTEKYEHCISKCQAGIPGFGKEQFSSPQAIAVDNASGSPSAGDVYVVTNSSRKKGVVDKFNFKGELLGTLKTEEAEGAIDGVAVDSSGTVWVDREDGEEAFLLERYNDATPNKELGEATELEVPEVQSGARPTRPGLAVDAAGDIYIRYEPRGITAEELEEEAKEIAEREKERKKDGEPPANEQPQLPCEKNPCLVAKLATFPVGSGLEAEPLIAEVDLENTSAVAADPSTGRQSSGDVYLNNLTSVAAFAPGGSLIQRFGEAQLTDHDGSGLAVDARTGEVLVGDAGGPGKVDVYELEGPGAPTAAPGSVSAAEVTASSVRLGAKIDPSGLDTHFRFRYGTVSCAGTPSPCTEEAPAQAQDIGAGYEEVSVPAVELTGLAPSTTYHFLAIATNGSGSVESEERTFTTLAANASEAALPDGRAWELVSPADKRGVAIEPIAHEGGLIQAAASGHGLAFVASAPAGEEEPAGNRAPELTQLISTRTSPGSWSTVNLTTSNEAAQGIVADHRREYQFFSTDLSLGAVFPIESLLASETEPTAEPIDEHTVYVRNTSCTVEPCYGLLATSSSAGLLFYGATANLQHAVVLSPTPLVAGATGQGLYEWSATEAAPGEGHFKLVSVLPEGKQATGRVEPGTLGKYEGPRNAMSEDGSRVVWEAVATEHLYESVLNKETGSFETTQIDVPAVGLVPARKPHPIFQTASLDGSKVFFTDDQRLTKNASPEEETTGDLYVYEPEKPVGERLTDLTPDLNSGESAAVQGGVIGASTDGAYVYFVANGVLAPNASPGNCVYEGSRATTCNLYVAHVNGEEWEAPTLIARLSNEDGPDWGTNANSREEYALFRMTSRVSSNGRFLAFMSDRRLTGYNNTDAKSGAADEEVFLYHAPEDPATEQASLVCASCNPSGAQPVGVHDIQESGEGRGLLVDRPEIWTPESEEGFDHWLAGSVPGWTPLNSNEALYQSNYLTDEGRLFFNSPDTLVRQASNGKEDVYEYEPKEIGGCGTLQSENTEGGCVALISSGSSGQESAFLDASANGNDVFFLTSEKLSPEDPDKAFDIYDARVCSGPGAEEACPTAPPAPAAPCESEGECKGGGSSPPSYGAPASSVTSGSGNLVAKSAVEAEKHEVKPTLTKKQLLEKAIKSCKRDRKKGKRLACEKQARKKYGATAAKAKKSNAKHQPGGSAASGAGR